MRLPVFHWTMHLVNYRIARLLWRRQSAPSLAAGIPFRMCRIHKYAWAQLVIIDVQRRLETRMLERIRQRYT